MAKADLLSRRADLEGGENDKNRDVIVLKPEWFANQITMNSLDDEILQRIRRSRANQDKAVKKALQKGDKGWDEGGGVVTRDGIIYVPIDKRLREDLIRLHHDTPVSGHPGRHKTQELITRNYWWPHMQQDIKK